MIYFHALYQLMKHSHDVMPDMTCKTEDTWKKTLDMTLDSFINIIGTYKETKIRRSDKLCIFEIFWYSDKISIYRHGHMFLCTKWLKIIATFDLDFILTLDQIFCYNFPNTSTTHRDKFFVSPLDIGSHHNVQSAPTIPKTEN